MLGNGFQVRAAGGEKTRIAATHPHTWLGEQPGRIAAGFPFGADIGTGAQDHVEALRSGLAYEGGDVVVALEVEFAALRFHQIPEYVGLHRVQAERTRFLQTVLPVGAWYALEMNRAGDDLVGLAVAGEVGGFGRKSRPSIFSAGGEGQQQRERHDE